MSSISNKKNHFLPLSYMQKNYGKFLIFLYKIMEKKIKKLYNDLTLCNINGKRGLTMKQNNMLAMILAGGRGSRLHDLTNKVAKPAVSYGGKYRIVD